MRSQASADSQALRSRRIKRLEHTQEIQILTTHRRRKVWTRGGVLAGFGMAMIVYPVMGTIAPYENSAQSVFGVVLGEAPTTAEAMLGAGPQLADTDLPLPSPDDVSKALALSDRYTVSLQLPDCVPPPELDAPNGELPDSLLCDIWGGQQLRADAAVTLAELNYQFKSEFGRNLCITSSYRTLSEQYVIKRKRGYLAATPGKSFHGWGLAIDLCDGDYRGTAREWLDKNAATYGWVNPDWAKSRIYEPWHWEYLPGTLDYDPYGNGGGSDGTREGDDGGVPSTTQPPSTDPVPTTDPPEADPPEEDPVEETPPVDDETTGA